MEFRYTDNNGNLIPVINNIDKLVIYGNGRKYFEREFGMDAYEVVTNDSGEKTLRSIYHGLPVAVTLSHEVKTARKENLNRKDNYTLTYTPELFQWERRTAIYIHISEIEVFDLGDILAMETKEEKNYLHAFILTFHGPTVFERLHAEYIQCDDNWKIPDGGRWSECYGTVEKPCYEPYDFTNSRFERSRRKGKGVIKRYITPEVIEHGAEIVVTERYYSKTVYSPDRIRKNAIAEKLNNSGLWHNETFSHYDVDKLETALGYKLEA